jgi:hypothetical protein
MLVPERFKSHEARNAASAIAVDWKDALITQPKIVGKVIGDRCQMRVTGPAISGDYAFLSFSNPGGQLGAYAFKKSDKGWEFAERVSLGFW